MDVDFKEKRGFRDRIPGQREKRWSMNSQRLEEIVAELMRPIGDLRRSFDTDLSALLEEYLTEAGLHALDADADVRAGAEVGALAGAPNFAELALLLQQSASIYGRKVDFLYQHVLSVSDSLLNSTLELANPHAESEEPQTPSGSRKRRRASAAAAAAAAAAEFAPIELAASAGARREPEPPRAPPTLPRVYIELEPRVLADADVPLLDYAGEPVGLLTDFHVAWRLQEGLLVDELQCFEGAEAGGAPLRPIPLTELQAALEAAAPPPPPLSPLPAPACATPPPACSTPLPLAPDTLPPLKRSRKRGADVIAAGAVKILISKELRRALSRPQEFSVPRAWIEDVTRARRAGIAALRRRLARAPAPLSGFELAPDAGGFAGWSGTEAARTSAAPRAPDLDSDDDGFFEQSSLGDSDASRVDDTALLSAHTSGATEASAECAAWQARVVQRAAAAEARGGVDVRALGAAVLRALPAPPRAAPLAHVLRVAARDHADVSRLFLATLFLANAGNVEVLGGAPLALDACALRLVSTDARLYAAAAGEPGLR